MIRCSILYPAGDGKKFDHDYYASKHMPMAQRLTGASRFEIDKGIAGGAPGAPAPYVTVGHLYFADPATMSAGFDRAGSELVNDIPNYTDIVPVIQVSRIVVG
jgi:uncharacterized protein (TIGR02118 family)